MGSVHTPAIAGLRRGYRWYAASSGPDEAVEQESHSQHEKEKKSSEEAGPHHRRKNEEQPHRFTSGTLDSITNPWFVSQLHVFMAKRQGIPNSRAQDLIAVRWNVGIVVDIAQ